MADKKCTDEEGFEQAGGKNMKNIKLEIINLAAFVISVGATFGFDAEAAFYYWCCYKWVIADACGNETSLKGFNWNSGQCPSIDNLKKRFANLPLNVQLNVLRATVKGFKKLNENSKALYEFRKNYPLHQDGDDEHVEQEQDNVKLVVPNKQAKKTVSYASIAAAGSSQEKGTVTHVVQNQNNTSTHTGAKGILSAVLDNVTMTEQAVNAARSEISRLKEQLAKAEQDLVKAVESHKSATKELDELIDVVSKHRKKSADVTQADDAVPPASQDDSTDATTQV